MNELCGVINVYKEKGYTSHDVVNVVRKSLNHIKTGHTGTLDPDAQGVLPICIGKATKLSDYIMADVKEYVAELCLGIKTTTADLSGEITQRGDVIPGREETEDAVMSFRGEIYQTPPMYSAIKVKGKKLYELAREGREVERKKRLVNIYEIEIIEFLQENRLKIRVVCSKGTYIRSLCDDIGQKLGCGGAMAALLRTRSGDFFLKDSIKLDKFKEIAENGDIKQIVKSPEEVLPRLKKFTADGRAEKYLLNGNKVNTGFIRAIDAAEGEDMFIYDEKNRLIGIYRKEDCFVKPVIMLI